MNLPAIDRRLVAGDCPGRVSCLVPGINLPGVVQLSLLTPTVDLLPDQLRAKITLHPSGCWLWTGSKNPKGYGRVRFGEPRGDGRGAPARQAHRVVFELLVGPIPHGLVLDHVEALGCRFRHCVNPAHLEPVTVRVNTLRGNGPTAQRWRMFSGAVA